MNRDAWFGVVDRLIDSGDPGASLEFLIQQFRKERDYPALFEARLMKSRLDLGLSPIQTDPASSWPEDVRRAYENAVTGAAREVGEAFLAEGNIERAWPYFRAIGETRPVAEAIEKVQPGENIEGVVAIALQEGVHPAKGLELILAQHGMCRAITVFGMYPIERGRQDCIRLLVGALHSELTARLKCAIAGVEGSEPQTDSILALIHNRDWLFGDFDYYVDTSHLTSVLQYSPELTSPDALRLVYELCEYGRRLSSNFQFRGHPPFEDPFLDYGLYAGALLGLDVEPAIAHFRRKVDQSDPAESGTFPAQVLVNLLIRIGRYAEALAVALDHLAGSPPAELVCPSPLEICRLAGDYERLMSLARRRGDVLSYTAAQLQRRKAG